MIDCKECGQKISAAAKACPHCGNPSANEKVIEAANAVKGCGCMLMAIGVLMALAAGGILLLIL